MAEEALSQAHEIRIYLDRAHQMLLVAAHNLDGGFYASAVNRAYYAIFYAASALLITQGLVRGKHSGVLAAFRQHFVRPGLIEAEYSDIYGRVMDNRHVGDYEVELEMDPSVSRDDLQDARRFVERVECYLRGAGWL
jgi:uncharacterized protein (UPF0332 family)